MSAVDDIPRQRAELLPGHLETKKQRKQPTCNLLLLLGGVLEMLSAEAELEGPAGAAALGFATRAHLVNWVDRMWGRWVGSKQMELAQNTVDHAMQTAGSDLERDAKPTMSRIFSVVQLNGSGKADWSRIRHMILGPNHLCEDEGAVVTLH